MRLYTPFDPKFTEELKRIVPFRHRQPQFTMNGQGKKKFAYWLVSRLYLTELVELCNRYWPDQVVESDLADDYACSENTLSEDMPYEESTHAPCAWIHELFERCPKKNVHTLYRGLSLAFHPDHGGDTKVMQQINVVYDRYR